MTDDIADAKAAMRLDEHMYKRSTQTAFAAMSLLAEEYDGGETRISAQEIAKRRDLQPPFLAKVLTTLAQARLVTGSRGPGGGFTLTRDPESIVLYDVFCLFENRQGDDRCPFGGGICGVGKKCPLHDRFKELSQEFDNVLHQTNLSVFRATQ